MHTILSGKPRFIGLLGLGGVLVLAPLISPQLAHLASLRGSNPPVTGDIAAPSKIETVLRQSCYDCHSNETRWPWYSRVAPVSWLIAREVERGRKEINFSEWNAYFPATRKRKLQWIERSLHEEVMPPALYRIMHADARLTEKDHAMLEQWLQAQIAELQQTLTNQGSQ